MKKYLLLSFSILILAMVSCQKEELSTAQLIAKELQSVIEENNVDRLLSYRVDQVWGAIPATSGYGENYKFNGEFVIIEGKAYNLNLLIKYRLEVLNTSSGPIQYLLLSFY